MTAEKLPAAAADPLRGFRPAEIDAALETNEDGDAALFVRLMRGRFVYDCGEARWHRWAGNYWIADKTGERHRAMQEVIDLYAARAALVADPDGKKAGDGKEKKADPAEPFYKRMRALHSLKRQEQVLRNAALGDDSLAISGDEWDRDRELLACANGVISLVDGALLPGRPEWFQRSACATAYDPDACAPRFVQFLDEVFGGDEKLCEHVLRLLGYALLGTASEHRLPILYGVGRNGKGTLLEVIGEVLGPTTWPGRSSRRCCWNRASRAAPAGPRRKSAPCAASGWCGPRKPASAAAWTPGASNGWSAATRWSGGGRMRRR